MTRVACLAVALVSVVPLAGCGGPGTTRAPATAAPATAAPPATVASTPPAPVTAADLAGRTFLIDAERSDGHLIPTTHGQPVTITFSQPMGGVDSGCNGLGAEWRVDDGHWMLVGDVYSTAMGCLDPRLEAQDSWIGQFVHDRPEIVLGGDGTIELRTATATLRGRDQRTVPPARPLPGMAWQVQQVYSAASGRGGGIAGLWATFGTDGTLRLFQDGCAGLTGRYRLDGNRVRWTLQERGYLWCAADARPFYETMALLLAEQPDALGRGDRVRLTTADGSAIVLAPLPAELADASGRPVWRDEPPTCPQTYGEFAHRAARARLPLLDWLAPLGTTGATLCLYSGGDLSDLVDTAQVPRSAIESLVAAVEDGHPHISDALCPTGELGLGPADGVILTNAAGGTFPILVRPSAGMLASDPSCGSVDTPEGSLAIGADDRFNRLLFATAEVPYCEACHAPTG